MEPAERCKDDGDSALAVGDFAGAERCYRRSVEVDPGFAVGWHALGMSLLKLGRPWDAVEAARKATELEPGDAMYWTSLSIALARDNRIKEAESAGAKARIVSWGGKAAPAGEGPATGT
jgi:tetratricopeptide (TPR) repeat protein